MWFGLGAGAGWGWFPTRAPEYYINAKVKGLSFGGWPLLPEIGYQWTDHIAFALQGRLEYLPADMGSGCGTTCPSLNEWAWAVLGRAYLFSDSLFGRASNLQLFGTGNLGAGTAFRLYVDKSPSANTNVNFRTSDTVRSGPFVAGVGGGVTYNFTNYFALVAELRALFGFWDVAMAFEGALSAQVKIWSPGVRRAPAETELQPEPEPDNPPIE